MMCFQNKLDFKNIKIQSIKANWVPENVLVDVLRLDQLHPIVSGNKWFKLKYYLEEAKNKGFSRVATFGGAYSNHIVSAAFACREYGVESIGIIRGERPETLSPTLQQAAEYGMHLQFVTREAFKNKKALQIDDKDIYWIDEGGYGILGARGTAEILQHAPDAEKYTHIICAVGTGTMFAGIVNASSTHQTVFGVSVLKNNFSIEEEIKPLINISNHGSYQILYGWHFGGYAKHPPQLIEFMQQTWQSFNLPTDIVYTSKTFYAVRQMVMDKLIDAGSRVLMIHSGGLQGNASLPNGVLSF